MKNVLISSVVLLAVSSLASAITWTLILDENFSTPAANGWIYAGPSGVAPLFAPNAGAVDAEWSQSKVFESVDYDTDLDLDPYIIQPASYSLPIGRTLTDNDYFQVGATVTIDSIVNTTTFYQVANFGLYNMAKTGPDRGMTDYWSGNSTMVKDACDFVEFNYFISNDTQWGGRNIAATMGAHSDTVDGTYVSGASTDTMWHDAYLGSNALPVGTKLYTEVTYWGDIRRARAAIYTDADRTQLLEINVGGVDVAQYYWTQALPAGESFTLTDVALFNYVGEPWGTDLPGAGSGSYDDVYVNVPEPTTMGLLICGSAALIRRRRRK